MSHGSRSLGWERIPEEFLADSPFTYEALAENPEVPFPTRIRKVLWAIHCKIQPLDSLDDLSKVCADQITQWRNCGKETAQQIHGILQQIGLGLKQGQAIFCECDTFHSSRRKRCIICYKAVKALAHTEGQR